MLPGAPYGRSSSRGRSGRLDLARALRASALLLRSSCSCSSEGSRSGYRMSSFETCWPLRNEGRRWMGAWARADPEEKDAFQPFLSLS